MERTQLRVAPGRGSDYVCAVCQHGYAADQVYDQDGRIVCEQCFQQQVAVENATAPTVPQINRKVPDNLLPRITCPHCWHVFAPGHILWISRHEDLRGDPVLGSDAPLRFLPTHYNIAGEAIDGRGMACQTLGCPRCHLAMPRALVHTEPLFFSIVGAPASGKSYFLTAMTWELRRVLPERFALVFQDADTTTNRCLNEYEETLFLQPDRDRPVAIRKTETEGELYDQIRLGQQVMILPRPFLFSLRLMPQHPRAAGSGQQQGRLICLYDNAGEHFQPGRDTTAAPVTQHLGKSRVLMFLYDPTQDPRFRERCQGISDDPQLVESSRTMRQETILVETALRVRQYAALPPDRKHDGLLVVIVAKSDVWAPLLDADLASEPLLAHGSGLAVLDTPRIEATSRKARDLLRQLCPEFVAAAESFCSRVVYIPCSALGHAPERQPDTRMLAVRAGDIKPSWVIVPFLYIFARCAKGLVATP